VLDSFRRVTLAFAGEYIFKRMDCSILLHALLHGFESIGELIVVFSDDIDALSRVLPSRPIIPLVGLAVSFLMLSSELIDDQVLMVGYVTHIPRHMLLLREIFDVQANVYYLLISVSGVLVRDQERACNSGDGSLRTLDHLLNLEVLEEVLPFVYLHAGHSLF